MRGGGGGVLYNKSLVREGGSNAEIESEAAMLRAVAHASMAEDRTTSGPQDKRLNASNNPDVQTRVRRKCLSRVH
jgi:hypothetical protein